MSKAFEILEEWAARKSMEYEHVIGRALFDDFLGGWIDGFVLDSGFEAGLEQEFGRGFADEVIADTEDWGMLAVLVVAALKTKMPEVIAYWIADAFAENPRTRVAATGRTTVGTREDIARIWFECDESERNSVLAAVDELREKGAIELDRWKFDLFLTVHESGGESG